MQTRCFIPVYILIYILNHRWVHLKVELVNLGQFASYGYFQHSVHLFNYNNEWALRLVINSKKSNIAAQGVVQAKKGQPTYSIFDLFVHFLGT